MPAPVEEPTESETAARTLAPRGRRDVIARPRLDRRFAQHADVPVVAIEAPAGFGKTLLLAQWRRAAIAQGAAAAWFSIEPGDDVWRLLDGIARALRLAAGRPEMAPRLVARLDPAMAAAAEILADWARLARPVVLVLDDVDRLEGAAARDVARFLIANVPPNGRVLLAARALDAKSWAMDLQAYGQLVMVGRHDLAFTLDEALKFLRPRAPGLSDDQAARVQALTEGWPAGLEIMLAALGEATEPGLLDRLIGEGAQRLADHLIASALDGWSPDRRTFLVEASILASLNADLCRAVTDRADATAILGELRGHAALAPDGDDAAGFRLHPLVATRLREDAARLPATRLRLLHQRAAAWLTAHGRLEAATGHALEAGDRTLALDCMEGCLSDVVAAGKFEVMDAWLARLPAGEIRHRRRLRMAIAIRQAIAGRPQDAELLEDLARSAKPRQRFAAAVVQGLAASHKDDPDAGRAALAEWRDAPGSDDPVLLRGYYNLRRWLDDLEGRPQKPRPWGEGASPLYGSAAFGASASLHRNALARLRDGQPMQAATRMAPGLARFEAQLGRRSAPAVLVAVSLAAAACELDDFEQIRLLLADRLDLLDPGALPDAFALGFVAAAGLAQHDREPDRARDLLDLLRARAKARGFGRIQAIAVDELVKLHATARRHEACEQLLEELEAVARAADARQSLNAGPIQLQLHLVEARVRAAAGDPEGALAASEAAIQLARALRRRRLEFEARLLRAAAILALTGEPPADLADVASLAETLALRRMLREADPALGPWLPRVAPVAREATGACGQAAKDPAGPTTLTSREAEVLRLLSRGLSNQEIADALDIGGGTIKWHLKNLFVKFEASDRRRVVARARSLGLISAE